MRSTLENSSGEQSLDGEPSWEGRESACPDTIDSSAHVARQQGEPLRPMARPAGPRLRLLPSRAAAGRLARGSRGRLRGAGRAFLGHLLAELPRQILGFHVFAGIAQAL